MKTFKQFFKEQTGKTAVIAFGRYNPPTIGHQKLIDKLKEVTQSNNADGFLVPSHTQNNKKDPLSFEEKKKVLSYMVPPPIEILDSGKTLITVLQDLQNKGYSNIIHIAGSDRIPEFEGLVAKYNNKKDTRGNIPFAFNEYKFESAGERDPDSEGVEGMSASKLRQAAIEGDYNTFKQGMAKMVPEILVKSTFNAIRERIK
jgi:hypothetical protein